MRRLVCALSIALLVAAFASLLSAQGPSPRRFAVVIPDSSLERVEDIGLRAHTNHLIRFDPESSGTAPSGETPQSIWPVYNLPATGGAGVIVIVDAFHYPMALNDFNVFSSQFGLPVEPSTDPLLSSNQVFQVVYASGTQPPVPRRTSTKCEWAHEAALDIEWAHAMAPSAKIVLVEAASNLLSDLLQAVDVANTIPGAAAVSMSWGGSEFSSESLNDFHFTQRGIVYFAASGNTGGATIYPSTSPNVVAAGGTTIHRDTSGNFTGETGWSSSGGGPSLYEPRPSYQDVISSIVGNARGVPDYSFNADPNSGVSIYVSTVCHRMSGWLVFGGTSVAAPSLAGIVNLAGHFSASSNDELTLIYSSVSNGGATINSTYFRDITSGTAGSFSAVPGWDFVTGVGSNQGLNGK